MVDNPAGFTRTERCGGVDPLLDLGLLSTKLNRFPVYFFAPDDIIFRNFILLIRTGTVKKQDPMDRV